MPSLSSGITTTLQALQAQAQALDIAQHNISNASTPGYRRQGVVLTAGVASTVISSDYLAGIAGQTGGGVIVDRIKRFNYDFFDGKYRTATADTKNWDAQNQVLSQLEPMLGDTSGGGLSPAIDQFWSDWQSLSTDPTNTALRSSLLNDAGSLTGAIQQRYTTINNMRMDQNQVVSSQVDNVNSLATQIAQLNGEIARGLAVGEQPNDLMDKRDLAMDQLSQLTGAASFDQKNGEVMVSIGGHLLVMGHDTIALHTQPSASDSSVLDVYFADNQKMDPPNGEMKGTLQVRDKTLVDQLGKLDTLAAGLIQEVNAFHAGGTDLNGNLHTAGVDPQGAPGMAFFTGTKASDIAVNANLKPQNIVTSSQASAPGNNDIALAIAGLGNLKNMLGGQSVTFGQYYNDQVTSLANSTKSASDNFSQSGLVEKALANQRDSVQGVSLDEEAANMAQAQKAYQAAARVMTTYDDMFDTIINKMGLVGR